ncbi:MAG: hypothetical protein M1817_004635 [Caeruleum heppii]|nr:MAG: hypothetical protein M1817_004635 [Caeruleum heppii]
MTNMGVTSPTPRPVPQKLEQTESIMPSPTPVSPRTPRSPLSAFFHPTSCQSDNGTGYFATSPTSDRGILRRMSPFRHNTDEAPACAKSASYPGAERSGDVMSPQTEPTTYAAINSNPDGAHGRIDKEKRSSGTYTKCGRNSNDWLFNGFTVRGTVKGFFEERKGPSGSP